MGLVRYDEAVREKAKERGLVAYTAADPVLTSRFLGAEYTRELSKRKYGPTRAFGRASGKVKDGKKSVCLSFNEGGCTFRDCKCSYECLIYGDLAHTKRD